MHCAQWLHRDLKGFFFCSLKLFTSSKKLLGTKGIATRNKKLPVTGRSKDATV